LLFVIGLVENPLVTQKEELPRNSTSSSSLSFAASNLSLALNSTVATIRNR